MKKFSTFYEGFTEKNDGNGINRSVTNHYTPIQNILTNINNLFCSRLGIVATESEDSYSIKLKHPRTGKELFFEVEPPKEFINKLQELREE